MYALTVGWGSTRNYNFICKEENTSEAKTILIFSIFFLNAYRYTYYESGIVKFLSGDKIHVLGFGRIWLCLVLDRESWL